MGFWGTRFSDKPKSTELDVLMICSPDTIDCGEPGIMKWSYWISVKGYSSFDDISGLQKDFQAEEPPCLFSSATDLKVAPLIFWNKALYTFWVFHVQAHWVQWQGVLWWYLGTVNWPKNLSQLDPQFKVKTPITSCCFFYQKSGPQNVGPLPSGKRLHNYGKSPFSHGKIHYQWPFSIAMLVITRG